jgi:hypothetical protein
MGRRVYCPRPPRFTMARVIVSIVTLCCFGFCCWLAELLSPRPWPAFESAYWSLEAPRRGHLCVHTMPKHKRRLRGKPRRGSPWRPRRPSFSSRDASPPAPSRHLQEAEPSHTPPTQSTASFNLMDLILRSPCSSLPLLLAPTGTEQHSAQHSALPSTLDAAPPPPKRDSGSSGTPSVDAATSDLVKDKLANLYGLVFELRQGVEDLQFRLQLSNEKATLFLQLLSSLHEAFLSTPAAATSEKAPEADIANDEAKEHATSTQTQSAPTSAEDIIMKEATAPSLQETGNATETEQDMARHDRGVRKKEELEVHWGDGTTIVEEEPWTGDLNATWPGYAPSV